MPLYIGLMSGTSMDGIDAALVEFAPGSDIPRVLGTHSRQWPDELVIHLHALCAPQPNELVHMGQMDQAVAHEFALAVQELLQQQHLPATAIIAIGSHGQTIRHHPEFGFTLQIGNGARMAVQTGIDVICDFRMKDVALGGQGAPLVPAFHQAVFGSSDACRMILNIGGISNVSALPGDPAQVFGFDTGPGNTLLDQWYRRHQPGNFDMNGRWAAEGHVHAGLLDALLAHPYFALPYPKSTGRETFTMTWLDQILGQLPAIANPADVQRTLLEFTALTIGSALRPLAQNATLYVCGGGAHNPLLLGRLTALFPDWYVTTTAELNMDPDWVEAIAFAWLAHCFCERRAGNLPAVTGASKPAVLGAYYPAH